MEYIIQTVDVGLSEVLSEKSFSNVTLVDGKQMLSVANVDEITGTGVSPTSPIVRPFCTSKEMPFTA